MAISAGAKKAVGYEINPILVLWSRLLFLRNPRIQIENENFLTHELPPETTVIYLFQVNKVMKKIPGLIRKNREKFAAKKIRVVCFGFELDGEKPVRELNGMRLYEFQRRAKDALIWRKSVIQYAYDKAGGQNSERFSR